METPEATEALQNALQLSAKARRSGRWYARYLGLFAAASFAIAIAFALVGPLWGAWLVTPLWVVFVVAISVYASRQRSSLLGTTRIHLLMILGWTSAWLITLLGSFLVDQAMWWWVLGGLAMAAPALVARSVVLRRIAGSE